MRILQLLALPILIVLTAFVASSTTVEAANVGFQIETDIPPLEAGTTIEMSFTVSFGAEEAHNFAGTTTSFQVVGGSSAEPIFLPIENNRTTATYSYVLTQADVDTCHTGTFGILRFRGGSMAHFASNPNLTQGLGVQFRDVPCTVAAYPNIDLIEQRTVCGAPDELVELQSQPAGVLVNLGSWTGTERVVSFSPAEGYTLVGTTSFTFTESGPCVTEPPVPPVQTEVCGTNNDAIGFPSDQPANVLVTQSEGWSQDSSWTVTFAAAEGYVLPVDTETQYILMDPGPCETSAPVSPVQTEVCGTNNDIISFPSDQPANVLVTQSDGWSPEGSWTVIFSAAEHHKLPVGTQTDYVFTDTAIPCPADSPAPPVQSAVCGPGNDLITIPVDQPTGISLASDSGWQKNIRTITFAVAPDFQTDGPTTFTFTDAADPCSIPTVQVTIQLQTEDGGSIEGSSWQLSAPLAAQMPMTDPYREGTVGPNNQIVLDDLIAGQYRLVVHADGYEALDETFMIEGENDQTITMQLTAKQAPAATSSQTAEPSSTEAAVVSGLPSTGAGARVPGIAYVISLILIVAGAGALTRRPAR